MLVRHYMVRSAVATSTISNTATLGAAVAKMVKNHMQQLLVMTDDGVYIGEITTFTLAKILLPQDLDHPQTREEAEEESAIDVDDRITPFLGRRVSDFVDNDAPIVEPETPLAEAIKLLCSGRLRLPVVEPATNKLVGVISSLTILRRYQF